MNGKLLVGAAVVLAVLVVPVVLAAGLALGALLPVTRVEGAGPITAEPQPLPAWDGTAPCPAERPGTRLLVDAVHGYCLLYPEAYSVERPLAEETVLVIGSLLNAEDARLSIETEFAEGRTAAEAADALQRDIDAALPGYEYSRGTARIAGLEAVVLDRVPGQDLGRQVLFVRAGILFRLRFTPADPSVPGYAGMETLYALVTESFAFLAQ